VAVVFTNLHNVAVFKRSGALQCENEAKYFVTAQHLFRMKTIYV